MVIAANQPRPLIPPNKRVPLIDPQSGMLSVTGFAFLNQLWAALNSTSVIVPATAAGSANALVLTPFSPVDNTVSQQGATATYTYSNTWAFTATADSTGAVTARVKTLPILNVFKDNGATAAGAGDILTGLQYFLTFLDAIPANAGLGGFIIR